MMPVVFGEIEFQGNCTHNLGSCKISHTCIRGYVLGSILELYGEEGCGKSQFLMHFFARCVLPMEWKGVRLGGHNIGVIFFDLDYQFNVLRFVGNKTLNLIDCARKVFTYV